MEFTGERMHPEINGQIAIEHLHRYAIALDYAKNKTILDIASGEGYGSFLLSSVAKTVYGVDISEDAVKHATAKYKNKNLKYLAGDSVKLPFDDSMFDLIVSFETIEHLNDHEAMMAEIKRTLKPNGKLIISSPDKTKYSEETGHQNAYHLKELYFEEFKLLIKKYFKYTSFYLQAFLIGSLVYKENDNSGLACYQGDFSEIKKNNLPGHIYNIAIASNSESENIEVSVFEGKDIYYKIEDYYNEKIKKIYASKSYRLGNFFISIYNKLFK